MALNKRIFYASHAVAFQATPASGTAGSYVTLQGGQSVSLNTDYGLEKIFQLGRLAAYDQPSINPEVEVTVSKALDGYPTIFRLATAPIPGNTGETAVSIVGASSARTGIIIGVGSDTASVVSDNYAEYTAVKMTGMYFENITYTFPTDGVFTEEITFRGNHKAAHDSDAFIDGPLNAFPRAGAGKGHVLARQNLKLSDTTNTVLPPPVSGRCISNITISAAVTREAMYCLGNYQPFHRYVNFPLEITTTFDTTANGIGQDSSLMFDVANGGECVGIGQPAQVPIKLALCDSSGNVVYKFDLGSGCQLSGHTYSGGDVGGGSVTETFTYLSYNELTVTDSSDQNFGNGGNDGLGTVQDVENAEADIPGEPTL